MLADLTEWSSGRITQWPGPYSYEVNTKMFQFCKTHVKLMKQVTAPSRNKLFWGNGGSVSSHFYFQKVEKITPKADLCAMTTVLGSTLCTVTLYHFNPKSK